MTRSEKGVIVEFLTTEFSSAQAIIACDFKGLSVLEIQKLRVAANSSKVKVQVVKNTLASLALKAAKYEGLELKENNIFIWGNDCVDTAKAVHTYAKENDKLVVKTGFIDGELANESRVAEFAVLPSRNELLGMLAATWMAPITNFTVGLNALRCKKEET